MLQRISFLTLFLALWAQWAAAQDGKIAGTVKDDKGNPVESATVFVFEGDDVKGGAQTDANGTYSIQPVAPGTYKVIAKYISTQQTIENVEVNSGQTRTVDIKFTSDGTITIGVVDIVGTNSSPVFEKDPAVVSTMNNKEFRSIGSRNIQTIATLTPGVYAADDGGAISVRGARESSTVYYIDGQKVRGTSNLPQAAIKQMQVITGGTPAEYGDFTGGVISITTTGASPKLSGGGEILTSQIFDAYGRNLVAANISGPVIKREEELYGEKVQRSVLGYFLNAEYDANFDSDPAFTGIYKMKGDGLEQLEQNPLRLSDDGRSFRNNALYTRTNQVEQVKAKTTNQAVNIRILGRIDIEPVKNMQIKLGGNVEKIQSDNWGITSTLFAPKAPSQFNGWQYRGWARLQQSFAGDSTSTFRNFFYQIQADYSLYTRDFSDRNHGSSNLFDYGFNGKFDYDRVPFYSYVSDPSDPTVASSGPYWQTAAIGFNNLRYDPSGSKNPLQSNYNNFIFNEVQNNGIVNPLRTPFQPNATIYDVGSLPYLQFFSGLRNGDLPPSIYGLFSAPGNSYPAYNKFAYQQVRLSGQSTAEIKGHNIKLGFEFEQRTERSYTIATNDLWGRMRQYANNHLQGLDTSRANWQPVIRDGQFQDTINIPLLVGTDQYQFDKNLRQKLGLSASEWMNIDNLTPEQLQSYGGLSLFSANELMGADGSGPLANSNYGAGYYGYDYLGNKTKGRVDAFDFFRDTVNRPMNAFSPTYISAFLQDKFEFEDINFNAGVRVDYFDANQTVLKDNYSLFPTFTAAEAGSKLSTSLPANIGTDDQWVAYVDNATNPTKIVGYRNNETWYDDKGVLTTSNAVGAKSNGRPIPYLKDQKVAEGSFTDYKPQTVVMPRLSFSFPLNETAQFFAHYDVLAQRPGQLTGGSASLLASQISDYYFLRYRPTTEVNNANLRPEITIDYEAGFKQMIGDGGKMAIGISAFYREMRNMVRYRRYNNAYPFSYDTYANLDFGTVKGLTLDYRMNRTKNLMLRAAYTLQFAQTTGSSFSSGRNVVDLLEGTGVLRTTLADDRDQRHRITGIIDYRFEDNDGPKIHFLGKDRYPFKQAGANLNFRMGSGTPYSQNAFAVPSVQSGISYATQIVGTPNGSRKPSQFTADLRVDKAFAMGKEGKYTFNVYFLALNVFNQKNVINVYRYTGLADNDGYLESGLGQQAILNQVAPNAFQDMYAIRMQNPDNFSQPVACVSALNLTSNLNSPNQDEIHPSYPVLLGACNHGGKSIGFTTRWGAKACGRGLSYLGILQPSYCF